MAIIVPTITASNSHVYREQIERVQNFAKRIHIDLMDGVFAPTKSISTSQVWWPENIEADIHIMYEKPEAELEQLIKLKPRMVIVHGEIKADIIQIAKELNQTGIKCGVALLAQTSVESIKKVLPSIQQLLIFSGNLGHQGGSTADLSLLGKASQAKQINPSLEIAWDGGVNYGNVPALIEGGIDSINVGGYIHYHSDPAGQYQKLASLL